MTIPSWLNTKSNRFFLIIIMLVNVGVIFAQDSLLTDYQKKAEFLYNFAHFIEWPTTAFLERESPLIIGVLGEDPFGSYLDKTVQGQRVHNHPVQIVRFRTLEEVKTCHIMYISQPSENMDEIIKRLKGKNILTVSDAYSFIERGGMISFMKVRNRIKININREATQASDLVVSPKLLKLVGYETP